MGASNPRADRDPDLHPEHVLPIAPLEPQEPGVQVPHHPSPEEVHADAPVSALGKAAVWALRVDPREQEALLPVQSPPGWARRRFVTGREQDGALVATRQWA